MNCNSKCAHAWAVLIISSLPAFILLRHPARSVVPQGWRFNPAAWAPAQASARMVSSSTTQPAQQIVATYGKLPLSFEANQGQIDPRVKFLSRGSGYALFLTGNEAVLPMPCSLPTAVAAMPLWSR